MSREKDSETKAAGDRGREPQSYGSESDWLSGHTDQTVDSTPERSSRHDESFYENRHDQDGEVTRGTAPAPNMEHVARPESPDDAEAERTKTDEAVGGRGSYFKDRDYREK